jgi:hypothetical protein
MPKLRISLLEGRPLLDIASYARRGPGRRDRLSPAEIAQIARTVRRVPEAVVKVLPKHSNNVASISRHIGYIGRYGDLELETDDGERLGGNGIRRQLLEDWDLDLDEHRRQTDLASASGRKPPKLVHKLLFSMPPGTPAEGVLAAARNFLREEFALKHRYAFVLHIDEPHPHVHAIVKAVSEQGFRLNIRKATLREWREAFARHSREQGIEANATERAVRGQTKAPKLDGIYRATKDRNRDSTHMRKKLRMVASELMRGRLRVEPGKSKLVETRRVVEGGWRAISDLLVSGGQGMLAKDVERFVEQMPAPRTEKEEIASELLARARESRMVERQPRQRPRA